jgi:hypothetical protein
MVLICHSVLHRAGDASEISARNNKHLDVETSPQLKETPAQEGRLGSSGFPGVEFRSVGETDRVRAGQDIAHFEFVAGIDELFDINADE